MENQDKEKDLKKKLNDVKSKVDDPKLVKAIQEKQSKIGKPFNK